MSDVKKDFIRKNIGLAFDFMNKHRSRRIAFGPTRPFEEALSDAYLGLVCAAQLFDPSKGRFSTYAFESMRNESIRALGAMSSYGRGPTLTQKRIRREERIFYATHGRKPDIAERKEIAHNIKAKHPKAVGKNLAEFVGGYSPPKQLSLDAQIGEHDDETATLSRFLPSEEPHPYQHIEEREILEIIREEALQIPKEKERAIVYQYLTGEEIKVIGERADLTPPRIIQIITMYLDHDGRKDYFPKTRKLLGKKRIYSEFLKKTPR